jgi:hypothetical protein
MMKTVRIYPEYREETFKEIKDGYPFMSLPHDVPLGRVIKEIWEATRR